MKARFQMALPSFSSVLLSSSTIFMNPFFIFFERYFAFSVKDVLILRRGGRIETGTGLAGIEFAMTDDPRLRPDLMQQLKDFVQDDHLLSRAIVLVLVFGTARVTALIADPDTVRVVSLDVATTFTDRSTIVQTTIPSHIEVITRIGAEPSCTMTAHQLLDGEVLVGPRVAAVQHQQANSPR